MLARKGELRAALVPRKGAPFSPAASAQPSKPHPRGGRRHNAGGTSRAERRIEIMTRKSTQKNAKNTTKPVPLRSRPDRKSITFELVARLTPHQGLADNLVRTFGLEPVDFDGIRDATKEHIARAAEAFGMALNEKALQIHLQRIAGAFVSSAFGAAQFYGTKKSPRWSSPASCSTTTATRTVTVRPASNARPNAPVCSPPRWSCSPLH
jgi:hypothetical protein